MAVEGATLRPEGGRKDVRFTLSNCSNKHANISRQGNERKRRKLSAQIALKLVSINNKATRWCGQFPAIVAGNKTSRDIDTNGALIIRTRQEKGPPHFQYLCDVDDYAKISGVDCFLKREERAEKGRVERLS
ncbi:unnamed protein product [Colias eurytheme]|nr:unnamed protein product [Colias eurytheme]